jgi:hypothetical protein
MSAEFRVLRKAFRACLKIMKGAVFAEKAVWRGATRENILGGSSTEESTKPDGLFRENPSGGGSFARGLRWIGRHGLLQGCSGLAALATAKIPRRSALQNFQTGSYRGNVKKRGIMNHGCARIPAILNPQSSIPHSAMSARPGRSMTSPMRCLYRRSRTKTLN